MDVLEEDDYAEDGKEEYDVDGFSAGGVEHDRKSSSEK